VKATKAQIDKALRAPGDVRFFLLHGPDEAASRALAKAIGEALGADAERIDLSGADLKNDPARLADEAAAISMFGGARWIQVEPAGEEAAEALEALLEAPAAGNPVAVVAGALRPTSKLLKLALAAPQALAFASYAPEGQNAERLALEMARAEGLVIRPDVARRIADACGGNRALIGHELSKYALYAGAAPEAPCAIDHDVVDLLGAGSGEGDLSRLVDCAATGDATGLAAELSRLGAEGQEGITLIRAMLRRMGLLARLRAEVESGSSVSAVMASSGKSLFWKDKDAVGGQLARWPAERIAKAMSRLVEAERLVRAAGGIGPLAADEELFAICRQAARLR
jgi:DNA polymerase-3 subunit delta